MVICGSKKCLTLALGFSFPRIDQDGTVLEIEFENGVLRFGALTFSGRAFNSEVETTLGQSALAGNAADMAVLGFDDGNVQPLGTPLAENLSVAVPISKNLLANINIQPSVFTPNGDGINDQSIVQYDITNIVRLSPVEVLIYDLSGRLVRRLVDGKAISGRVFVKLGMVVMKQEILFPQGIMSSVFSCVLEQVLCGKLKWFESLIRDGVV